MTPRNSKEVAALGAETGRGGGEGNEKERGVEGRRAREIKRGGQGQREVKREEGEGRSGRKMRSRTRKVWFLSAFLQEDWLSEILKP